MRLFILLMLSAFCVGNANAADIFINKNPKPAPPSEEHKEIMKLMDKEVPDAKPLTAQPQNINEFANQYYNNCMTKATAVLNGNNLETLCTCTAAQIPNNMTVDQMKAMNTDTEEGALQRGRMLLFVYAPCIEYPTKALIMDQCVNNPDVKAKMKKPTKVCDCLSSGMADFMRESAPEHIRRALEENKTDLDPLRELMESKTFDNASRYHMATCVQKHELSQWGR